VRVGVYSDFSKINSQSVRILGRGLGIVTFSPQWQVAAGVWYLDRLTVKILPAGGVIWTPNQDTRFALLFPNPKIWQRQMDGAKGQWRGRRGRVQRSARVARAGMVQSQRRARPFRSRLRLRPPHHLSQRNAHRQAERHRAVAGRP